MTRKDRIEGNRLITEFRGLKPVEWNGRFSIGMNHCSCTEDTAERAMTGFCSVAKYSKSWDWLMPVVEMIENMKPENNSSTRFQFIIKEKSCLIRDKFKIERDDFLNLHYKVHESKLLAVWFAIVEFLKWYNEKRDN